MTLQEKVTARQNQLVAENTIIEQQLIDNDSYITYLAETANESDLVTELDNIMSQLSAMKAIVTNDGSKYKVNCFSVSEFIFGPIMSRVLGIITASSAMFTDERQKEFEALTGIKHLAIAKASDTLGAPAYYNKGTVVDAQDTDLDNLEIAIISICQGLNIPTTYAAKVTEDSVARWFLNSEKKAIEKMIEFQRDEAINIDNSFTIED